MPSLGPCCVCQRKGKNVRNALMLKEKCPTPGKGWGCVVCGLPADGAVAVVCDACLDKLTAGKAKLKYACKGFPATDGRVPIETLAGIHEHDNKIHAQENN